MKSVLNLLYRMSRAQNALKHQNRVVQTQSALLCAVLCLWQNSWYNTGENCCVVNRIWVLFGRESLCVSVYSVHCINSVESFDVHNYHILSPIIQWLQSFRVRALVREHWLKFKNRCAIYWCLFCSFINILITKNDSFIDWFKSNSCKSWAFDPIWRQRIFCWTESVTLWL